MPQTYTLTSARAGGIPYLELAPAGRSDAPLVLVLHGLGSAKENMLPTLYAFAEAGFRAVGPDLRLHGTHAGAEDREARLASDYGPTVYEIIAGSVADVAALLDHLGAAEAAVHGLSLGGMIVFAALLAEPRLTVASVVAGTPDWVGIARAAGLPDAHPLAALVAAQSPLNLAPRAYPPRPLLMLHGALDDVIPVGGVVALEERLRPAYAPAPDLLELVVYPDLAHAYTDDMRRRSVAWTERHLSLHG